MCIAIYKPSGKEISKATLQTCFDNNNDGCGFAYINQSQEKHSIELFKYMEFESFYTNYSEAVIEHCNSDFLIHFRITSHGTTELFNCHPFKVDDDHVFIHNGIISSVPRDKRKSDTQMFNETILSKLPYEWMDSEGIQILVEEFIGGSKLVVLRVDGKVVIYNEKKGSWVDGCWFSNDSYKERITPLYGGNNYRHHGYGYGYGVQHKYQPPAIVNNKLLTKKKEACSICGSLVDTINMFSVRKDCYICYDCMEMADNCESEIFELNYFEIGRVSHV